MTRPTAWRGAIALLALAGCGTAGDPSVTPSAPPVSAPGSSAESSPAAVVPIAGTLFGDGVISTDDEEYRISFAPDGRSAYFARSAGFFPQAREATIMETRLVDGEWSEPTVAAFSGTHPDIDPWVSPDGDSIYFSSIRPVDGEPRTDAEIFRVDREGDGWGEPVHLAELGSTDDELGASVTSDGIVWFASDRPGGAGGWDLYTAEPSGDGFAELRPVDDFNTPGWEFNPAINAAGDLIVFTGIGRRGAGTLGDLLYATLTDDGWSADEPVPMNTPADEYHASFSPDGSTLYYVKRTTDGDLYEVSWPPR